MRVRFGGFDARLAPGDRRSLAEIERGIAAEVQQEVIDRAIEISPQYLRRMGERVKLAATSEARKLMDVLVALLDRPGRGLGNYWLRSTDLMVGSRLSPAANPGGSIRWAQYTHRYLMHKRKRFPTKVDRTYVYTGALRDYFKGRGRTIIENRLGGVEVQVDDGVEMRRRNPNNRRYRGLNRPINPAGILARPNTPVKTGKTVEKAVLGRITVTMFPRVGPSLVPMLASRRWTTTGTGALEREIFGGTRAAHKLASRTYRPLFTPALQFFMLVRIPGAITATLNDYFRRTGLR